MKLLESPDGQSGGQSVGESQCLKLLPQFLRHLNETCNMSQIQTRCACHTLFYETWPRVSRAMPLFQNAYISI